MNKKGNPFPKTTGSFGSVHQEWRTCGRANCRCARGHLHGPYYVLRRRDRGRQRKEYVPREKVAETLVEIARGKAKRLPLSHLKLQLKHGEGL